MTSTLTPSGTFVITAGPGTDLWRKPPSTDVSNVPTQLGEAFPLKEFRRARITVAARWEHRYDQGGLILMLSDGQGKTKWLKTGIEFYSNAPQLSTVGCDAWADWSIYPIDQGKVTVEVTAEEDENGVGLWVYQLVLDEAGEITKRKPVREVAWMFAEEEGWSVEVGAYAARPAKGKDLGALEVSFEGLQVERT